MRIIYIMLNRVFGHILMHMRFVSLHIRLDMAHPYSFDLANTRIDGAANDFRIAETPLAELPIPAESNLKLLRVKILVL